MKHVAPLTLVLGSAGILMATTIAIASQDTASRAPGASAAFTSTDPAVIEARSLLARGEFARARQLAATARDKAAGAELVELVRRAREDYPQTDDQVLARIRKEIPDATPADLDRWVAANEITYRVIDGKRLFFSSEPKNLFKLSADARGRRDAADPAHTSDRALADSESSRQWKLTDHLAKVVADATRTGAELVDPVHHRIKYSITVTPADAGGHEGSLLRVWLPYPQEYRQQKNVRTISMSPDGGVVAPNGTPQRTIYFEKRVTDPKEAEKFTVEFEYDSFAYYPRLDESKVESLPSDFDRGYLAERPPHIVFTPAIRQTVAEIVGDETNPLAKVRKIYHWLDAHVKYRYEDEYCTIPSFADRCMANRRGDCGIQSTLFITMCRAAGVPARWQSGWETKVVGWTMHDWAEFYVAPWGWLPGDASYKLQKSDDPAVREFYIGHQDAYRMIVNLDYGRELVPPKHSLRSEPADFQRGEVELDGKNLYFDQWDYHIDIDRS